jgi:GT2 family glycosyltransferase
VSESASATVSVIVVTWNSQETIGLCLDSVLAQKNDGVDIEVIVVDNASTDRTLGEICQHSGVQLVAHATNLGFCRGNNVGIQLARGKYILLLNPDAALTKGFLKESTALLEADPRIALLTGKVLRMQADGSPVLQDGLPVLDTVGVAIKRNRQTVEMGNGEVDRNQYDTDHEVFAVSGALCLCRAQALSELQVDGQVFDDAFFAYKEDVDLSWRARLLGWKCVYTPRAVAYHVGHWRSAERLRKDVPRTTRYHSFKNRRLMILKNDILSNILYAMLPVLWFELRAFGYVLLREPFLLKAYWDIFRLIPRVLYWRQVIRARCRVSARDMQKWSS